MMKADRKPVRSDDSILSAFDPVVEGASFQILEEGLDPVEFARLAASADDLQIPEVLVTFDLAESLARVPEKLFFRIGEVAELLEVKTYVLRFWETEFPMVSPQKSRSGQRVYRKKDVEMLLLIKHLLYVERFSIEGARKRIRELRQRPGAKISGGVSSPSAKTSPAGKSGSISEPERESLRVVLADLEKLAKPELSKFFRF